MTQDPNGQTGDRRQVLATDPTNATAPSDDAKHEVLAGGGQLGARMRVTEWSATALGSTSTWPQSLRSALSICIGSRFPIAIYWGRELALLYNDAWRPILGEKHPWALGRAGREVWPEIWDTIGPMFQHVLATGEATYSEDSLLLMRRHGYTEECFFNFTFSPIRGEGGGVDGIFNAVIETTYRVLAERRTRVLRDLGERVALASSTDDVARLTIESLAEAPADVAFCALYLVTDGGRAAKLGASAGIDAGGPAAPLSIPLSVERDVAWPLAEAWQSRRIVLVDGLRERFEIVLPGGSWPEPASSALVVPIVLPSGEHPHAFLILGASPRRAVDEQYMQFAEKAASQLAASFASALRREELDALDRAKTAFFSNVSHEFRTPLTLMLAPIEDMRAQPLQEEERNRVELLHRNSLRLLKLVNSLLDFSRIEAGRTDGAFEPTDLASITTDLASIFRSAIERAGLAFVVDCPPLREPVFVDRDMWEKIVLNLLSNAFKFTFEGSIAVRLRDAGKAAVLEVSDTGTGIAEEEQPRLFERFHRIEGARSRSHEGSGIGLALVHELVRMHGGEIEVHSRLGEGTTFRVSVPYGKAHVSASRLREGTGLASTAVGAHAYVEEALRWGGAGGDEPVARAAAGPAPHEGSARRERILVADDNADMREYVARLLRERWDVETVADGNAALTAMRRSRPDLVVSDVMMPGLDGFALLRTIRGDEKLRTVPVVLLSARAGEEATSEGLNAGADDYLIKPFTARDLLVRVAARLATSKARDREHRRFLSMLERIPAIVNFLRGPNLIFEFAHPKAIEAVGGRQLVGKPALEAIPEYREQPEIVARLRHVLDTDAPSEHRELDVQIVKEGELRSTFWDSVYLPIHDDAGRVEGVMTFDLDVTDRVLARRALEASIRAKDESLDRYRALVEATGEIVWTNSPEGEMRGPQPGWCSYTGQSEKDVQGYGWSEAVHPEDAQPTIEAWKHAVATRSVFIFEHRVRGRDGVYRWFAIRGVPVLEPDGTIREWVGLHRDVDDEKKLEEQEQRARVAAEDARARLHSLFMNAPAPICVLEGPEHRYTLTNLPYNDLVGRDDLVGKTVAESLPEAVAQGFVKLLDQVFTTGEAFHGKETPLRIERPGSGPPSDVIVNFVYQPFRDPDGRVRGILVIVFDVTDVVGARLASEKARLAAEASEKTQREVLEFQERFVAVLGHDLRNPLSAIDMATGLLKKRAAMGSGDEQGARVLDRIASSSKRMSRMVEQILDLTRSRIGGGIEVYSIPVDLCALLTGIVDELLAANPTRTIVLHCPSILGSWDRDRLEQVFSNLIGNAIHHGQADKPVAVDARLEGAEIRVDVHNDGPPIPDELRVRLFDPFRRGGRDSRSVKTAGLGLGLFISRQIIAAHGGAIDVRSNSTEGTTFRVTLPRTTSTSPPE